MFVSLNTNINKTKGFRVELQVSGGRDTRLGSRQRQVRGKTRKRQGQDRDETGTRQGTRRRQDGHKILLLEV